MSESRVRLNRKQRMLRDNPICCFCGGNEPSTSEDHIPPRACFPPGYHPEGMEFPACDDCNQSTRRHDDVFGFYAMSLDYDQSNFDPTAYQKRIAGLINNYPEALPRDDLRAIDKRRKLKSMQMRLPPGTTLAEAGIMSATPDTQNAVYVAIRKLASALYYKETGKILSKKHRITGMWQQTQDAKRRPVIEYLNNILPEFRQPGRRTIPGYGKRFCYKFGYIPEDDFFSFAAQIGEGIILSGMTISPGHEIPEPTVMPIWRVDDPWVA